MKKFIAGLLTVLLVMSLAGCGVNEKLENKIEEEFTENILEEAGAGDVDVEGDKVTFKGESGDEMTFGGGEWPTSELAKSIPEFEDGVITSVVDSLEAVMITLESVKKEDASTYMKSIKDKFPQESYEATMDGLTTISGVNDSGIGVTIFYADEIITITVIAALQE